MLPIFGTIMTLFACSMSAACNFDGGECTSRFSLAGTDAMKQCSRSVCSIAQQDAYDPGCYNDCFSASCDYSEFLCQGPKASLKSCPLFDSAVFMSYLAESQLVFLDPSSLFGSIPNTFWKVGYEGYGRCSSQCQHPVGANSTVDYGLGPAGWALKMGAFGCNSSVCTDSQAGWAWAGPAEELRGDFSVQSVEFWIQLAEIPGKGLFKAVFSSETLTVGIVQGKLSVSANIAVEISASGSYVCKNCILVSGMWMYVQVQIKQSKVAIYTNSLSGENYSESYTIETYSSGNSPFPSFVLNYGFAVGRKLPDAVYMTQLRLTAMDNSSFFNGAISGLRLWGRTDSNSDLFNQYKTGNCAQLAALSPDGLRACFDFNRSLQDYRGKVSLSPRSGDKFLPWCTAREDGGRSVFYSSTSQPVDYGENWGFCSTDRPLPSAGNNYLPDEMIAIAKMSNLAELASRFPGCGRAPLHFVGNRAAGKGGGVYRDSCDTSSTRRSECFIDGGSSQSGNNPAQQVLFVSNKAGLAGGAVYVECTTFGPACVQMLDATVALPTSGDQLYKVLFNSNRALGWGDDLATAPAKIDFAHSEKPSFGPTISTSSRFLSPRWALQSIDQPLIASQRRDSQAAGTIKQYVPGLEAINFTVVLFDNRSMVVRNSENVVRIRVCASVAEGGCIDDAESLVPVPFFPFDPESGLCHVAGNQPIVCARGYSTVDIHFSVAGAPISPLVTSVECLPCPDGSARQDDIKRGSWKCAMCSADQYILDSNNPAYSCHNCPLGGRCNGRSLEALVAGEVWQSDPSTGLYLLKSCPPGYFLSNTDSSGSFSHDSQDCIFCPATFYCLGGVTLKSACPQNAYAPAGANSSTACITATFVDVSVWMPLPSIAFSNVLQVEFRRALADASGAPLDRVSILRTAAVSRRLVNSTSSSGTAMEIDASIAAQTATAAGQIVGGLHQAALNDKLLS